MDGQQRNEIGGVRWFLAAVTLFQPVLFVASHASSQIAFDPWQGRALMTILTAVLLLSTFVSSWAQRHVHTVALLCAFALQAYLLALGQPNDMSIEFFVGLVMTTAVMQTLCRTVPELLAFAGMTLVWAGLANEASTDPPFDTSAVLTILSGLLGAVGVMLMRRSRLEAQVRRTSAELATALEEVRELDAVKTRFFANVSHELRTPLQLILGPLEPMLRGVEPPGGTHSSLQSMQRSAVRLHRLIDQLLDLARVDAGAERLDRQALRPQTLLDDVAATFAPAADQRGISIRMEHTGQMSPISADPHWLQSALTNLVANALRHGRSGDTVTLGFEGTPQSVTFWVADTGPGIPAEDLGRIFDRFAQSKQRAGGPRGTGLGLAIVREAARLHGGDADVHSVVGRGTTFRLVLPRVAATDEATARPKPTSQPPLPTALAQTTPEVQRYEGPPGASLVVVAEDEPDLRAFVAETLAEHHTVVACADGEQALAAVQQHHPELVVTDLNMPGLTGVQLCQAIRDDPHTARIPVVLLTAHRAQDHVLAAYTAGASDYLTKPFHAAELRARCIVQLRLQQLQRDAVVRERLASLGSLAGEVSHHVRNPLNLIANALPFFEAELAADARSRALLPHLRSSVARIDRLTADLQHLASTSRSTPVPTHPMDGLRSVAELLQLRDGDTPLEIDPGPAVLVRAVPGDLNQAFLHVLDAAIASTGEGGRVSVRGEHATGSWVCTVDGSGPGLPPEQLDLGATLSTGAARGVGLGLVAALEIVTSHHGNLTASDDSSLGGTRFRVSLPLLTQSGPQDPVPTKVVAEG
ncbi:MAG: response regulator [Myxococcales bacterium]|nr:response regulator [Myxococcales bacterium]